MGLTSESQAIQKVRDIQTQHMSGQNSDKRPWSDIAYNFLVDSWGNVYEGRGWNIRSAANCPTDGGYANARWIAVCYLGGVNDPFTDAAKGALSDLIATGRSQHGVGKDIYPHSHFYATECPGNDLRVWITNGLQITQEHAMSLVIEPAGAVDRPQHDGGWAFGKHGHVYAYAGAQFYGSWDDQTRNDPKRWCVALVSTKSGNGYWLVSNLGELAAYGDAVYPGNYQAEWGAGTIIGAYANNNAANWGVTLLRDDGVNLNRYALPV